MNVKTAIELLSKLDPEATVFVASDEEWNRIHTLGYIGESRFEADGYEFDPIAEEDYDDYPDAVPGVILSP